MPRISAATVAEHREAQVRALLDAAREIMAQTGTRPTLAKVGARAGLARSSVYQYFASADDLVLAVVDDLLPRWESMIADAMSGARTPGERVLGYLWANLKIVADGEHAIASVLGESTDPTAVAEKAHMVHRRLGQPLVDALKELGVEDVELSTTLVTAVLGAAAHKIEQGAELNSVWRSVEHTLAVFSN